MDRRTRRHCRRLAPAIHTDRVDRALVRHRVAPLCAHLLEARLLRAVKYGYPLLRPGEGTAVRALLGSVLDVVGIVYPRNVSTVRSRLDDSDEQPS